MSDEGKSFVDVVMHGGVGDIRPLVAKLVNQGAEILAADARDIMRNGENRDSSVMIERGEKLGAIVIAAQWWAADWEKFEMLKATIADIREWAMANEVAAPPLDWAELGNILRTVDEDLDAVPESGSR